MIRVALPQIGFATVWTDAARRLASHRIAAEEVDWTWDEAEGLFAADPPPAEDGPHHVKVPRDFAGLAGTVICHRDVQASALAYQALARHQQDPAALRNPADPLTRRLEALARAVRRDIHKMQAFVRFRELPGAADGAGRRSFGAWFEPDHAILERATPFFARRFADMDWMIATPQGIARFDTGALTFHPPGPRPDVPDDASESLWATYFQNIFNPARIHLAAMRSEMPMKYWKNLPETRLIPDMLTAAEGRVQAMRAAMPTEPPARAARILDRLAPQPAVDLPTSLADAAVAARSCTRCDLCQAATQTVWGEGDPGAALMIVGEQPGDAEDLAGRPFVGPAGQLLRSLVGQADLGPVWMTNAVKHFKFMPRGKRRLHQSPNRGEIQHCRWWLGLERRFVAPRLTVALGASAAFALTGDAGPMAARRGGIEAAMGDGGPVLVTWHPSYVLRLGEHTDAAAQARAQLLGDLRRAASMLAAA